MRPSVAFLAAASANAACVLAPATVIAASPAAPLVAGLAALAAGVEAALAETICARPTEPSRSTRIAALCMLVQFWLGAMGGGGPRPATLAAGCMLGGIVLRAAAILALGADFTDEPARPAQRVSWGPYAWLRHPSEAGLLLLMTGTAAVGGRWAWLWLVAVILPLMARRIAMEDRLLYPEPAERRSPRAA